MASARQLQDYAAFLRAYCKVATNAAWAGSVKHAQLVFHTHTEAELDSSPQAGNLQGSMRDPGAGAGAGTSAWNLATVSYGEGPRQSAEAFTLLGAGILQQNCRTACPALYHGSCALCMRPLGQMPAEGLTPAISETVEVTLWHGRTEDCKRYVHFVCGVWAPEVYEDRDRGNLLDLGTSVRRARQLKCTACKKSGAALSCHEPTCMMPYHLPCAQELGFRIQPSTYHMWCPKHSGPGRPSGWKRFTAQPVTKRTGRPSSRSDSGLSCSETHL